MIGSAQKENQIYLDSIAGKWNTLRENMKALVTNNVSSDLFKGVLDGANKVVVAIDKITSSLGKIGTAGAIVGIVSLINTMSKLSSFSTASSVLGSLPKVMTGISTAFSAPTLSAGISTLTGGFKKLVSSSTMAKVAMGAFKGVLVGLAFTAVIAGISACIKAWDKYAHATENAVKASQEKQTTIRDEMQTLNTQKSSLSGIATEYDKLSRKTNKTAEEMSKFNELKKQVASVAPELVKG